MAEEWCPDLGFGVSAWPTSSDGEIYYDVEWPGPYARHGDFVHLKQVLLINPQVMWMHDPSSLQGWIGLVSNGLLLLTGKGTGISLPPPQGTHVTLAAFHSPEENMIKRMAGNAAAYLRHFVATFKIGETQAVASCIG